MPAVPFADAAAAAVVLALNGAGLTFAAAPVTFTRSRFPKYALSDVRTLRAHVVPVYPCRMDPHDDAGTATETPLGITFDLAVEKDDAKVSALMSLIESVAAYLARHDIPGVGYPIEELVIDRDEELLDQGHFAGGIGAVYRVYRDGGPS